MIEYAQITVEVAFSDEHEARELELVYSNTPVLIDSADLLKEGEKGTVLREGTPLDGGLF